MSSKRKRASVAAAFVLLVNKFPKTFTADPKCRKPFKVGIADDLIVRIDGAIRKRELRLALMLYCGSVSYLRNCEVGAERLDLDGNAVGVVTETEAAHAVDKLKAAKKKAALATKPQPPPAEAPPKKLSLADLRNAARMRREAAP